MVLDITRKRDIGPLDPVQVKLQTSIMFSLVNTAAGYACLMLAGNSSAVGIRTKVLIPIVHKKLDRFEEEANLQSHPSQL